MSDTQTKYEGRIADILSRFWIAVAYDVSASKQNDGIYTSRDFFAISTPYMSEAFILGHNAATEAMAHANQTWLTWQKGYPTVPGLYRLKYEDGTVIVRELCFRVMNQTRRYLGFANEFAHPIEDDEDLIAWAGPIPEPGE
ncbi:MAG: hypothetical protein IJB53_00305 [Mailhella sp.]|nr:hypothetical protein [Mailhella sp.]